MVGMVATAGVGGAAPWPLPPIDGAFSGEFVPPGGDKPPIVAWQVAVKSPQADTRTFSVDATSAGEELVLAADGRVKADRAATWRLTEGRLEIAPWLPTVRFLVPAWPAALTVAGTLRGSGHGQWPPESARPSGTVKFDGGGITVDWSELPLSFHDVALEGSVEVASSDAEVSLRAARGEAVGWAWSDLSAELGWNAADGLLAVKQVQVRAAGGVVTSGPFSLDPAEPRLDLQLHFVGVQLETFARLLPDVVAEARGEVSGNVGLTWSAADGLTIKGGQIALREGSSAQLRLRPTPGLITNQLPPQSPAFEPLQRVEMGKTPLAVRALLLALEPADDPQGRSAVLRVEAEPLDPGIKAPIIINVNVSGPLNQLIKLSMDDRVKFGG